MADAKLGDHANGSTTGTKFLTAAPGVGYVGAKIIGRTNASFAQQAKDRVIRRAAQGEEEAVVVMGTLLLRPQMLLVEKPELLPVSLQRALASRR